MAKPSRMRVPQDHGAILEQPPIAESLAIVESNQRLLSQFPSDLQAIRKLAQKEIPALALNYSNCYLQTPLSLPSNSSAIAMSGHQPTLFHPGVWFKNVVLHSVATLSGATPINLVVDNDLCDSLRIRTPQLRTDGGSAEYLSIDQASAAVPFEARSIIDRNHFEDFGRKLAEAALPLVKTPLIETLWPQVIAASDELPLPASLAAGRHQIEVQNGVANLELPISQLCTSKSFATFLARIIENAAKFREIYNESLGDYRIAERIRSRSHPVPELESTADHHEIPFWFWTAENPLRRRLFAKVGDQQVELSDQVDWSLTIRKSDLVGAITELNRPGSSTFIRPRALATTMFSRLFASDLFIHGIGGAKYDELGDQIARRFFGVTPPQWMTISATMKLPFDVPNVSRESIRELEVGLRELRFHPEREFPNDPRTQQKQELIKENPAAGRKAWHQKIEAINQELFAELTPKREALETELFEARELLPIADQMNSREFSFALFPRDLIDDLKRLAE